MLVVLIRHAHSQANAAGILSGRLPNIALSEKGAKEAADLAIRLGKFPISEIRVSPLQRCLETITPWHKSINFARKISVEIIQDDGLLEVDYGLWSERKLVSLFKEKLWKTVQNQPSRMYFPQGEGLAQMQTRALHSIHQGLNSKKKGALVIVSHGDVIKSIIASALGMHLDDFQRIVIDPASISILDYSQDQVRALLINDSRSKVEDLLNISHRKRIHLGGGSGTPKTKVR